MFTEFTAENGESFLINLANVTHIREVWGVDDNFLGMSFSVVGGGAVFVKGLTEDMLKEQIELA